MTGVIPNPYMPSNILGILNNATGGGISSSEPTLPATKSWEWDTTALKVAGVVAVAIAADDATGIGVVDDVLIPIVGAVGAAWCLVDSVADNWDIVVSWFKPHETHKQDKNWDKHTNPRSGGPEKKDPRMPYKKPLKKR